MLAFSLVIFSTLGLFLVKGMAALLLNLLLVFFWIFLFLLISLRLEFLAISFLIIYLGAIAILFVFGLMVIGIQSEIPSKQGMNLFTGAGILLLTGSSCFVISQSLHMLIGSRLAAQSFWMASAIPTQSTTLTVDVLILGQYLYSEHWAFFWTCGALLLVAIFGVIAATTPTRASFSPRLLSV